MSQDKSSWATGGGLLLGLGIGLAFFLPMVGMLIGYTIAGLGLGLIISALISRK